MDEMCFLLVVMKRTVGFISAFSRSSNRICVNPHLGPRCSLVLSLKPLGREH